LKTNLSETDPTLSKRIEHTINYLSLNLCDHALMHTATAARTSWLSSLTDWLPGLTKDADDGLADGLHPEGDLLHEVVVLGGAEGEAASRERSLVEMGPVVWELVLENFF